MLRKIIIFKDKDIIYQKEYGKSLAQETLYPLLESLRDYLGAFVVDVTNFMQIINFKLAFATHREFDLLFVVVADPTDKDESIKEEIEFIRHKFLSQFTDPLADDVTDPATYATIQKDVDVSKSELRPKISLVGFSGVGKTTITKLIKEEEIPMRHIPTITGYISEITVEDFEFYLWDLAGQVRYAEVWAQFMRGSDVIILITDSTEQNIYESRFFVELCRKEAPFARFAVVANKQDLPDALSVEKIAEILDCGKYGYKTVPLVAIDTDNRIPVVKLLAETAATSATTIAPFQTLDDRKNLIAEVQRAVEKGFLREAAKLLDEIATLSELKGDPVGAETYKQHARFVKSQATIIDAKTRSTFREIEEKIRQTI